MTAKIHDEFVKASQDPLIVKRAAEDGASIRTGPTEDMLKLLAYDYDRLGKAVKAFGIKAE